MVEPDLAALATQPLFFVMASQHLGDRDGQPLPRTPEAADETHLWIGLLGGLLIIALAVLAALGMWHLAGSETQQLTAAELTEAEALLDQLGFPPGPIDGVIDEKSRSAIRDFQLTGGLTVDGRLDMGLLSELRAATAELGGINAPSPQR